MLASPIKFAGSGRRVGTAYDTAPADPELEAIKLLRLAWFRNSTIRQVKLACLDRVPSSRSGGPHSFADEPTVPHQG